MPELTATACRSPQYSATSSLDLINLPFETGVDLGPQRDAVPEQISSAQHLEDFLDLFFADQFHSRSWHVLRFLYVSSCRGRVQTARRAWYSREQYLRSACRSVPRVEFPISWG